MPFERKGRRPRNFCLQHWWIDTRDKPGLLWAFLQHFSDRGLVSFEGTLSAFGLLNIQGATPQGTVALARQTRFPVLDLVTVPVRPDSIRELKTRLSSRGVFHQRGPIIHVQIEHAGRLVLGAYDNFHRRCVVAYPPTPEELLERLRARGTIRSYSVAA